MPFLDAIELADALEDVTDTCVGDAASEAFLSRKGHAVVRQNGMYAVREGNKYLSKELRCIGFGCSIKEGNVREFLMLPPYSRPGPIRNKALGQPLRPGAA